jgi:hypothetical protein
MGAKRLHCGVLILSLMGASAVSAQPPSGNPNVASPYGNMGIVPPAGGANPYQFDPLPGSAAQNWSNGLGSLPVGRDGPVGEEIYFWNGPSFPIGGGILDRQLNPGWMSELGGRGLLFNAAGTAAWTVRGGVAFQYNNGSGDVGNFDFFGMPVKVRDYFRWSGVFAMGRDWFLSGQLPFGPRNSNLRAGFDVGGFWGTSHVNLNLDIVDPLMQSNFLRRHDVFGGIKTGTHVSFEIPLGGWVWVGGIRTEYGFNFTDIMPDQKHNIQDLNVLLSTGFRY